MLTGPEDDETCPYAGAAFRLLIQFPDDYSSRPPEIHVATPILHVNVSAQGRVCHSVLDREYSPSFGMDHLLCCVASLLIAPDTNDPFNAALAILYHKNPGTYDTAIRDAVIEHASRPLYDLADDIMEGLCDNK